MAVAALLARGRHQAGGISGRLISVSNPKLPQSNHKGMDLCNELYVLSTFFLNSENPILENWIDFKFIDLTLPGNVERLSPAPYLIAY